MCLVESLFGLGTGHFELFLSQISDLLPLIKLSCQVKHMSLCSQPCPQLLIRQHLIHINSHLTKRLTDQLVLCLINLLLALDIGEVLVELFFDCLLSGAEIGLERLFHEEATCDGVDALSVHLLNIFHERANRDFIRRLDLSHMRQELHIPHPLDRVGDTSLDGRLQAGLVSVVNLARVIHELGHHGEIAPVDLFLGDGTHELFPQIGAREGPVDENGGSIGAKLGVVALVARDHIVAGEVGFGDDSRVLVAVLLLVLVRDSEHIVFLLVLVVLLGHGRRRINSHILPQCLLHDPVDRELLTGCHHHLPDSP